MHAIEMRLQLKGSPERAFRALTDTSELVRWWGPKASADVDLTAGGRYRWAMELQNGATMAAIGQFTEISRPERLGFSFAWEGGDPSFSSDVVITLTQTGDGTELFLVHEGFASEQARDNHAMGWEDCLERLEQLLSAEEVA